MPNPSKEVVRHWQQERNKERKTPPDTKQIRREMGWDLIEAERLEQEREAMRSVMK
jgi:hypothetical protein